MNLNSKIRILTVILFSLLVFLVAPKALAVSDQPRNLCSQIENINSRIQDHLKAFNDSTTPKHPGDDLNRLEESASQQLASRRGDWDKLRADHYNKLDQRAKTDEQHQAVKTYKETIEDAVVKRRNMVDQAIVTFRTALGGFVNDKQSQLDQLVQTYKDSVDAALQKAQNSCNDGSSPEDVRTNLANDLKSAREQLQSSANKVHDEIETSRSSRQTAIQAAIDQFKQTAQAARQTLEQALGQ